ncbi:MAG: hypothetical protein IT303_11125 [Dehalococcoidia bacterium]|nr:hypothetical protein [Dehalococcoidia bacterium]
MLLFTALAVGGFAAAFWANGLTSAIGTALALATASGARIIRSADLASLPARLAIDGLWTAFASVAFAVAVHEAYHPLTGVAIAGVAGAAGFARMNPGFGVGP